MTGTTVVNPNEWNHVALSYNNGVWMLFLNGVKEAQRTKVVSIQYADVSLGYFESHNLSNRQKDGYIDELRITKGVARYTTNFDPPTEPFPNFGV